MKLLFNARRVPRRRARRPRAGIGALALAGALLGAGVHGASAADTSSAAERLDALLADTTTIRATFTQEMLDDDGRVTELAEGRVEIARPGRFRWEYAQPYEQVIVTDGHRVWMYDVDLAQVSVSGVQEALASSPAMLLGGGELADGFRVVESASGDNGRETVVLEPRFADTDFTRIAIEHDGEVVRAMDLLDALGQRTVIRFEDIERGVTLDDTRFEFRAPEGVDVLGLDDD